MSYSDAIYDNIVIPRHDVFTDDRRTLATRHPEYVYSTTHNACLVHRIQYLELSWWAYGPFINGQWTMLRRIHPRLIARSYCDRFWHLESKKARACFLPTVDAVRCNKCYGLPVNFPRHRPHEIDKEIAKVRLGCIVTGARI